MSKAGCKVYNPGNKVKRIMKTSRPKPHCTLTIASSLTIYSDDGDIEKLQKSAKINVVNLAVVQTP